MQLFARWLDQCLNGHVNWDVVSRRAMAGQKYRQEQGSRAKDTTPSWSEWHDREITRIAYRLTSKNAWLRKSKLGILRAKLPETFQLYGPASAIGGRVKCVSRRKMEKQL